jgi:hypothetical protein
MEYKWARVRGGSNHLCLIVSEYPDFLALLRMFCAIEVCTAHGTIERFEYFPQEKLTIITPTEAEIQAWMVAKMKS